MQQSGTIGALTKALVQVQGLLKGAKKDANNTFFKSKYADLESVWEACRAPLSAHGLAVFQTLGTSERGNILRTTLAHESGEWVAGEQQLSPVKDDPQAISSAITYARRSGLAAIIGIVQVDDDAEAAMSRVQPSQPPREQNKQPTPTKPLEPEGAGAFRMPFGDTKGTQLMDMDIDAIDRALKWAASKGKFEEFQVAAKKYLDQATWQKEDLP